MGRNQKAPQRLNYQPAQISADGPSEKILARQLPGQKQGCVIDAAEGGIMETILIVVVIILLLGGGGWYGRGRWY
jgi:hypothetical protein